MLPISVSLASPSGVSDKRELNWSGATGVSLPMRVQMGARGCTSKGLPTVGKYSFMGVHDPDAFVAVDAVSYTHLTLPTNREV